MTAHDPELTRAAWDRIAAGYDQFVTPTEVRLANEALDLDNVAARVMDGHALELEDNAFDVSGSQFGVMLFPNPPRALEEMVRVTKPGGQVLLIVYGPPAQVEFLGFFLGAAQAVLPGFEGLPANPPPLEFQVSDPEKLRGMLRERSGGNGRAVLTNPVH